MVLPTYSNTCVTFFLSDLAVLYMLFVIILMLDQVPPHMTRLTPLYVAEHSPLDVTNHSVAREVVTFFPLPPGDYIVVPQTNVPNCDGKFLLRILTDEQSNIW